ncbi:acyl-[acyl-carrier-protein] thioesterase [Mongoliitalea daihaiensis]|uniref:acyl-[acyl-carrier-protein] thioesterase n=1 Tax=Mongoliitalea daihaiensis TaxID=2782006 RepID=UPI001F276DFA|nr:acyl-ACP thioesterase domain-containing protein [Mongoliitalea daihaiensis]UJP65229.1 acyl-ACP thioesterase [Mongoliitalea daihaiensis]
MNQSFQFEKDFEVLSFQIDPQGKLRWSSLADMMQEVAWRHADSRDFGQNLFDQGYMWVMSRFEIKVQSLPSWGEKITVKTAGRGIDKLFALREFQVCNEAGQVLATAMSAWLLLDMESKRPQRPDKVLPSELFAVVNDSSLTPAKVLTLADMTNAGVIQVRYSDLDMNNHVNNVSYIRWVEDFMRERNWTIQDVLINYLAEISAGQLIHLTYHPKDVEVIIEGRVEGKVVFSAVATTSVNGGE